MKSKKTAGWLQQKEVSPEKVSESVEITIMAKRVIKQINYKIFEQ